MSPCFFLYSLSCLMRSGHGTLTGGARVLLLLSLVCGLQDAGWALFILTNDFLADFMGLISIASLDFLFLTGALGLDTLPTLVLVCLVILTFVFSLLEKANLAFVSLRAAAVDLLGADWV